MGQFEQSGHPHILNPLRQLGRGVTCGIEPIGGNMISDVLSDAIDEIQRYLNDPAFSRVYSGDLRDEIKRVIEQMERLRAKLDRLPAPGSPP
jgi:hypothetical protein